MKRIIISLLSAGVLFSSCTKDFDKINTSPNNPEEYLSYALFANASFGFMYNLRKNKNSASMMRSWMQYTSQTSYTKESRYIYSQSAGDNIWWQGYKRLNNLKTIIDLNRDPETKDAMSRYGDNIAQISASRAYMAYIFSILAETFGDIPYYSDIQQNNPNFQALQTNKYVTPVYASQKDIYLDILQTLGQVSRDLNRLDENGKVFEQGDFLFTKNGISNIGVLKHFANSLRLRIANHLKNVRDAQLKAVALEVVNYYAAGHDDELLQPGENIEFPYEDSYDYCAPIYNDYFLDARLDYAPSNCFVKLLAGNNKKANDAGLNFGVDPRIEKFFAPKGLTKNDALSGTYSEAEDGQAIDTTRYAGMPYGMAEGTTQNQFDGGRLISLFASSLLKSTATDPLMEYSEVCFILSEIRGWNQAKYVEGVQASMDKWGVSAARATAYINNLPAASQASVLTQKYISLYMNSNEAWTEYRRTGYPKTLIKVGDSVRLNIPEGGQTSYVFTSLESTINQVPDRLNYPLGYTGLNVDNYKQALINMGMGEGNDLRTHRLIFAENRP